MEINEAIPEYKRYTYADYCAWDDGERREIIDGISYAMAPGATNEHQSISMELAWQLRSFLQGKHCKVRTAPLDVRLNADHGDDTVVQPDILVVCDKSKFSPDGKGVTGAPEFVAEILSPSSEKHDRIVKYKAYQRAGVREYWIIDPTHKMVVANVLSGDKYVAHMYFEDDMVPVQVLDGCTINLAEIFAE